MVRVSGGGGQFFSLRESQIPNLSLLQSLEPFKKFVVVGCGLVVVVETYFSVQL